MYSSMDIKSFLKYQHQYKKSFPTGVGHTSGERWKYVWQALDMRPANAGRWKEKASWDILSGSIAYIHPMCKIFHHAIIPPTDYFYVYIGLMLFRCYGKA